MPLMTRSALAVRSQRREPTPGSRRPSNWRRTAPPFLIWTRSPSAFPVKRYETIPCNWGRCPTTATEPESS